MKRYRYLILLGVLFLGVLIYYGTYRVISINIGDKGEVTTDYFNIENTIDLFDTTQVHEIKVLMTEEEYKDMIDTYSSTSEKDWYKTDVIIDGVLISDVGVRLKGNSSLRGMGGGVGGGPSFEGLDRGKGKNKNGENNMMGGAHGNRKRGGGPGGMGGGPGGGFPGAKNSSGDTQNSAEFTPPSGAPEGREDMPTPPDFQGGEMGGFPGGDFPGGEKGNFPGGNNGDKKGGFGNGSNTLKTRLLANEKFKAMYDEIYTQIEEIALNSDFSENFFSEWSKAFNDYSDNEKLVSESSYSQGLEKLKSYLENKKS